MINKNLLQKIINKYYLNLNESVSWKIKNYTLSIDFMTPTKDVIGNVTYNKFPLKEGKLFIIRN